ncbi:MAG: prolipoprotein diacylglyceryl transferase [Hyphomicrobiales bacterium]
MPLLALPFPQIDPVLFEFGPLVIRWYALAYISGIVLGWLYARRLVGNAALWGPAGPPLNAVALDDFVTWATLGIILGGRIGYVVVYDPVHFLQNPAEILAVWHGGMSFHGGLAGTALVTFLFARRHRIPGWSLLDLVTAVAPIGLLFGRIANFINGELWGRPSTASWAVAFPSGGDIPRHPSQLYEAALEGLVLFLVLQWLVHRRHAFARPGLVAGAFAIGYGVFRIFCEFFREPDIQIGYLAGGLTMGMALSIPLIALGLWAVATAGQRAGNANGS